MLIYNTQSILCHMPHVTCRALHVGCHMTVERSILFFGFFQKYNFESANLYWITKKKKERQGPFASKKVIEVSKLFTTSDLIAWKNTQCPKARVLLKHSQITVKTKMFTILSWICYDSKNSYLKPHMHYLFWLTAQ